MAEIELRDLEDGDLDWCVAQHAAHYTQHAGFNAEFGPWIGEILREFDRDRDPARERAFIAVDGETRLGSIFCAASGTPGLAKLRCFFVVPEARGRGLGQTLTRACLNFARDAGYTRIELHTHEGQTTARAIYAASGFVRVSARPSHFFGVDAVEEHWTRVL